MNPPLTLEEIRKELEQALVSTYTGQPADENALQIERDKLYFLEQVGYGDRTPMFDVTYETTTRKDGVSILHGIQVGVWTKDSVMDRLQWIKTNEGSLSFVDARVLIMQALLGLIGDSDISFAYEQVARYFEDGAKPFRHDKFLNVYEIDTWNGRDRIVIAESVAEAVSKWSALRSEFTLSAVKQIGDYSSFFVEDGRVEKFSLFKLSYEDTWAYYCLAGSAQAAIGTVNSRAQNLQNRSIKTLEVVARREDIIF